MIIPFASTPPIDNILRFFTDNLELYQITSRNTFLSALSDRPIPNYFMSVITFSIIFIIIAVVFALFLRKKLGLIRMIVTSVLIVLCFFGYQLILAILYVFVMPVNEATWLASYERYTSTYLLGMVFFLLTFITIYLDEFDLYDFIIFLRNTAGKIAPTKKEYLKCGRVIMFIMLIIFLAVYIGFISYPNIRLAGSVILDRSRYSERSFSVIAREWMPYFVEDRPLLIDQGSTGFTRWIMRYELMPYSALANVGNDWSISTEPYPGVAGPWTFVVTPDEWEQHILNNDIRIIYVYHSDEILENTFGMFFTEGVKSNMVYRVFSDNGSMVLLPVIS